MVSHDISVARFLSKPPLSLLPRAVCWVLPSQHSCANALPAFSAPFQGLVQDESLSLLLFELPCNAASRRMEIFTINRMLKKKKRWGLRNEAAAEPATHSMHYKLLPSRVCVRVSLHTVIQDKSGCPTRQTLHAKFPSEGYLVEKVAGISK